MLPPLLFAAGVTLVSATGYGIMRSLAREDRILVAAPTGAVAGLTLWTAGLNSLGKLLTLPQAGWLTVLGLAGLAGLLRWLLPPPLPAFRQPMATALYEQSPGFTLLYRHPGADGERRIYAFRPTPP